MTESKHPAQAVSGIQTAAFTQAANDAEAVNARYADYAASEKAAAEHAAGMSAFAAI